jgi:hypothetical protein
MDLKAIRDHLRGAQLAIGEEHKLSARIRTVERHLTPGDSLWRDDALSAQTDLLAILAELEQLPKVAPMGVASGAEGTTEQAEAVVAPGVNAAIKEIGAALELL